MADVRWDPVTGLVDVPVRMERPTLSDLPQCELPAGYRIRAMQREDAPRWTEVQREAERVISIGDGLFAEEFGSDAAAIAARCFLLEEASGRAVGTISAWYTEDYKGTGKTWGRIHWFAIRASHQGKGLARPTLGYAMGRLAAWHSSAWLATSTSRLPALKLYLDFGFVPDLANPGAEEAWQLVRERLAHPALQR